MKQAEDIIAAIATPIGEGGISVIRISGKGSIELADRGFRGSVKLKDARSHTVHFGRYVDPAGAEIDEVLVTVFREPHSYTAEDVVEVSCHGGMYVTKRILESVIAYGARHADPGEFTKRAFLNGRLDLSQAEAVADLIHSRSQRAHRSSLIQLQGSLSNRIKGILDPLLELVGLVELELDFVEENLTLTTPESVRAKIEWMISEVESLLGTFTVGRLYRDGVKIVLVGRPNAGKSSLLNTLLDQNRAIVTEFPGTTRDVIEENLVLDGVLFRLVDTAGIRHTNDPIESEGVNRTREQIKQADVCLYVIDLAENEGEKDKNFIQEVRSLRNGQAPIEIFVGNKIDLLNSSASSGQSHPASTLMAEEYFISAKSREGIQDLTRGIVRLCLGASLAVPENSVLVTSERHKLHLDTAQRSLKLALDSIMNSRSGDVLSVDLRAAVNALGSIVGTVTTDDILNSIFSKFCIGK